MSSLSNSYKLISSLSNSYKHKSVISCMIQIYLYFLCNFFYGHAFQNILCDIFRWHHEGEGFLCQQTLLKIIWDEFSKTWISFFLEKILTFRNFVWGKPKKVASTLVLKIYILKTNLLEISVMEVFILEKVL